MPRATRPTAIVLGGTHDHVHLINLLRQREYHTLLVDYYENPPARAAADEHIQASTLDRQRVLDIAANARASLVVATCIDQALLTMAYVAERLELPCPFSYQQALDRTNKLQMKRIFCDHGIRTSRWAVVARDECLSLDDWTWPLVVKPADANSSKGITKVAERKDLEAAIQLAMDASSTRSVILEEYVEGPEYSVDVVVNQGEPRVVMVSENRKMTGDPTAFTIIENVISRPIHEQAAPACQSIAGQIARAFGIEKGPMLIQLIMTESGPSVVEFSSRIGGGSKHHIIKKMTGFDIVDYFVDAILGTPPSVCPGALQHEAGAMNYVYGRPGTFEAVRHAESLRTDGVIDEYFLYRGRGTKVTGSRSSSDRLAGFLTTAESPADLRARIQLADDTLEAHDEHGVDIMLHGQYGRDPRQEPRASRDD